MNPAAQLLFDALSVIQIADLTWRPFPAVHWDTNSKVTVSISADSPTAAPHNINHVRALLNQRIDLDPNFMFKLSKVDVLELWINNQSKYVYQLTFIPDSSLKYPPSQPFPEVQHLSEIDKLKRTIDTLADKINQLSTN